MEEDSIARGNAVNFMHSCNKRRGGDLFLCAKILVLPAGVVFTIYIYAIYTNYRASCAASRRFTNRNHPVARRIQSIAPTYRARVQFSHAWCVYTRKEQTGSPTQSNPPRAQGASCPLGATSSANESIFEIGRRPTAARSFGKIVTRRFV